VKSCGDFWPISINCLRLLLSLWACGQRACVAFTVADITALVAIDIGGRLAELKIAPELANLTRWHQAISSRPSAKA
jgi:glutathione S-transferase